MRKIFLGLALFLGVQTLSAQSVTLEKLWETKDLPTPESVLHDSKSKQLYVSLIDGAGNVKDAKGGVAILHGDGSVKSKEWITGLNAPKGMALHKDFLYVADIDELVIIDVKKGAIVQKIKVEGATFLNDVTVDKSGKIFISDTRNNKIYQLHKRKISLYLESVHSVNGLKVEGKNLLVLAGPEFWIVDKKKDIKVFTNGFELGGDGLEPDGKGNYIVTCWGGLVYFVKPDGTFEKILDVQGKMNTADLGINTKEQIIYIPTFNSNSVIAYKLK